MKILIIGATGFLGARIARFLRLSHEVVGLGSKDLDITERENVFDLFCDHSPKMVIHLAAIADPRYCEAHPDDSAVVNVAGAVNVAQAAAAVGAKLVFASSEQVYNAVPDGAPNVETFDLEPATVYARHKLQAELDILELLPTAVCLRLTWMYDIPSSTLPAAGMLARLIEADRTGNVIKASTRERRGVTNVWEVARRIEAAFSLPGGVYNFGSTTDISTFDLQLAAAHELARRHLIEREPSTLVLPDETWTRNLALDLSRLHRYGISFPSSITGLHNALAAQGKSKA